MKKHVANGKSLSPLLNPQISRNRGSSEPSQPSTLSPTFQNASSMISQSTKDDAYEFVMNKGKKALTPQPAEQTSPSHFNPRQLLDPVKFDTRTSERRNVPSKSTLMNETNGNSAHKRDYDESESQGMGNLIERVYNVSQREERPQKKQKAETFNDEEEKKATYGGGGKGGDLGEYMKQKKKEGLAESSATGTVVDLTGGMSVGGLL